MPWSFGTDDDFEAQLAWAEDFVRTEIEPLDLLMGSPFDRKDPAVAGALRPLQDRVKAQGLWAAHLMPALGGQGYGQVNLALLQETFGASRWAPSVFGCQAPDSGNAEILARFGTDEQRTKYLDPLLAGEVTSSYAMTEPQGGSDPTTFQTRAVRDGDSWILNGEKWFVANARYATFLIVMAVTDPEAPRHDRLSMFLVPADADGISIRRNMAIGADPEGEVYGHVEFADTHVATDHMLGGRGEAFAVAQTRLSGGRLHHAMRTIGVCKRALAMACERTLSRASGDRALANLGVVEDQLADSWLQIEQFRLLVLQTAWKIDHYNDYRSVRQDIAAVKAMMPIVYHDVVRRAMHLHGALGVSEAMPFSNWLLQAEAMALADGPTEVHKATVARQLLKQHRPGNPAFPTTFLPHRRAEAAQRLNGALPWVRHDHGVAR